MAKKVLFSFVMCLVSARSFNLESRIPVIKQGKPGSYFGYSVAEHATVGDGQTSWLLVGAPLDQNLQPNTTQSGALWKCPLTASLNDCEQVITDGKLTGVDELMAPQSEDIKHKQWLGVSVSSQGIGGKIVVCAHRYTRKSGQTQDGFGLCYTLNDRFVLEDMHLPCLEQGKLSGGHERYGLCQAGTSSAILSDNNLVIGSPGSLTWRGSIFTQYARDSSSMYQYFSSFKYPSNETEGVLDTYSYLGMAVTGAKFYGPQMTYAAGAPRSQGTGLVVIITKDLLKSSISNEMALTTNKVIHGEQLGSNFGYEITSADVNGDGLPDLLVGAPFYYAKEAGGAVYLYLNDNFSIPKKYNLRLTGEPESQFGIAIANAGDLNKDDCDDIAIGSPYENNGVVYIHLGNKKTGLNTKPDQVIKAESLPILIPTFGHSLSGGIDLDGNGYPDLLVGAFLNSSVALIRARPIIDIKTWTKRPKSITTIDPTKRGCSKDPNSEYTCFHFEACCNITSLVQSSTYSNQELKISYSIEAETFNLRKFSRVFFGDSPSVKKSNIVTGVIKVSKGREYCQEHVVYLKNNTRDIQTPINFQLSYKLIHPEPKFGRVLPNIDDFPMLNASATTVFSGNFYTDCGDDQVCISDLVVQAKLSLPMSNDGKYVLNLGQNEEIQLEVNVDNNGESAYEGQLIVRHHEKLQYVASSKHVFCSSFNKTTITCTLENPFKKQKPDSPPITLRFETMNYEENTPTSFVFTVFANSTSKELTPREPVKIEAVVIKNAELLIKGVSRPEQVFYGGEIKGESAIQYLDEIGSSVTHMYQVFNEGPIRVNSIQVHILWPYQLASDTAQGKWLLYLEEVPTVDREGDQNRGECFVSRNHINPLNFTSRPGATENLLASIEMDPFFNVGKTNNVKDEDSIKNSAAVNKIRRRREVENIAEVKAQAYTDKKKQVVNIDCLTDTAKCIQFECIVYQLGRMQAATITIKARLWNTTLVEDYPRAGQVVIASSATLKIDGNIHQNNTFDDVATVETVAYPDLKITEASEVPLWVIIVSVLVGLIVLILLILALWKLGFFKRSRPDPTLSGNLEKNNHEASPFIVKDRNSLR